MKKKVGFVLLVLSVGVPVTGRASGLYLDFGGMAGQTNMLVPTGNTKPSLIHAGAELTLGYFFWGGLFAGFSSSVRMVNQYSSIDTPVGNRRGNHFNYFSPMLGLRIGRWVTKLQAQVLGKYDFADLDVSGSPFSYSKGKGAEFTLLFPLVGRVEGGGYVGYYSFSSPNVTPPDGLTVSSTMNLWEAGITLTYNLAGI